MHQRHRWQTDRQTTDGIAIAYSERNVVTFAKNQVSYALVNRYILPVRLQTVLPWIRDPNKLGVYCVSKQRLFISYLLLANKTRGNTKHYVNRVCIVVWLLGQNFGIGLVRLALTKDSTSLVKILTSTCASGLKHWPRLNIEITHLASDSGWRLRSWPEHQG